VSKFIIVGLFVRNICFASIFNLDVRNPPAF